MSGSRCSHCGETLLVLCPRCQTHYAMTVTITDTGTCSHRWQKRHSEEVVCADCGLRIRDHVTASPLPEPIRCP